MKTIRRRKRRRLSKQTKIFLSFTILVLGLIGLCLFSYPKLDLKAEEIDIGLDEDFNFDPKVFDYEIRYKDIKKAEEKIKDLLHDDFIVI